MGDTRNMTGNMPGNAPENWSFERRIGRLEEIVNLLEKGNAPLSDSLALFEEGTGLIAACSRQLDEAEQRVVKLTRGPDGMPAEEPFPDLGK